MIALSLASFFTFGIVLVLPGANQSELARDLGLDLRQTGLLASALSLGLMFGVVCAGRRGRSAGRRGRAGRAAEGELPGRRP